MGTTDPDHPEVYGLAIGEQLLVFLDQHREMLVGSLDGLSEDEVRRRLVGSSTTMLGLVKHATFVERVWFDEAVTGASRAELGIAPGPEESFELEAADTIESVRSEFRRATQGSRAAVDRLGLDAVVSGNRRGPLPLRWILLHVLRELAHHCGHADILREQLLAARQDDAAV